MWAESMWYYNKEGRNPRLTLSKGMEEYTAGLQKEFMPEDSDFGMVEAYLEKKENEYTCIKEIYCVVFNQGYLGDISYEMDRWGILHCRLCEWFQRNY